jgi:hypothetical protein
MMKMLLAIALTPAAMAQCPLQDALPPAAIKNYPMISDRYAVQYSLGGGPFTDAKVYISYYGGSLASPPEPYSGYTALQESMSFASISVQASVTVQLRVTKLFGTPFQASDQVSVRPGAKGIHADLQADGTVQITTTTSSTFAGEQFLLWWSRGVDGGAVESLVFFFNPPYSRPAGNNVKVVSAAADLTGDLSAYDTLDFEGTVAIGSTGNVALLVPANIINIFLGPDAWVKGKIRFPLKTVPTGITRHLYGPGVLDGSLFDYEKRACGTASAYPDQGYYSLTAEPVAGASTILNNFAIDGIAITDHNHAANDLLFNSTVNNVKTLGWNGENASLRLGNSTTASNLFIRSGDDSLMTWGTTVTVTNATIWQNYNGGVVNLGWANNSFGDYSLIDGLYVVKTDWRQPTNPSWMELANTDPGSALQNQNNAVFASLMTPGTKFGSVQPPLYRNIFVDDPPQVLFSLKILPPICATTNLTCVGATLTDPSSVALNIENLTSPVSAVQNSIGFQTLPAGYSQNGQAFPSVYTLTGSMNIGLTNITLTPPNGTPTVLTSANAGTLGKLSTNGANVNLSYAVASPSPVSVTPSSGTNASATYTFTFSDPRGYQDLGVLNVLMNNFLDGRHGCYLAYVVASNSLFLVDDAGDAGGPYAANLQNSQCAVTLVSATGSGNNFTLVLSITWTTGFAGDKIIYTAARDAAQNNSGWYPLGVARIPGGTQTTTTAVVSAAPARVMGVGPTAFTFAFSDSKGFADLGVENVLVNNTLNGAQACYIAVSRPGNVLFLMNDAGTALSPPQSLTAAGSVSNSQCTVSWAANPLSGGGNNLSLMLNLGFTSAFDGNQVIYVATRDVKEANSTDWHAMATQTVQ